MYINGQYVNQGRYKEMLEEEVAFLAQQMRGSELVITVLLEKLGGEVTLTDADLVGTNSGFEVVDQIDPPAKILRILKETTE